MLDPRLRDDNGFHVMPLKPTENGVDIHADAGRRAYRSGQGGNAGTEVRVAAKNARFREADADPGDPSNRSGKDVERPVRTMRRHFAGGTSRPSKVIVPDPHPAANRGTTFLTTNVRNDGTIRFHLSFQGGGSSPEIKADAMRGREHGRARVSRHAATRSASRFRTATRTLIGIQSHPPAAAISARPRYGPSPELPFP